MLSNGSDALVAIPIITFSALLEALYATVVYIMFNNEAETFSDLELCTRTITNNVNQSSMDRTEPDNSIFCKVLQG